jgi:hypothetical protein
MGEGPSRLEGCGEIRDRLHEVALGVASGDDRAAVLRHVSGCSDCRRELAALTELADGLLLLAPRREPPAGFESRVLEQLDRRAAAGPRHRPRAWRALAIAASLVVAASLGAAGAYLLNADERDFAGRYRAALAGARGEYFVALPLVDETGRRVGHVFGYQGDPSWVFVALAEPPGTTVEVTALTRVGARTALGTIGSSSDGMGFALHGDLHHIGAVEVTGGGSTWRATFPAPTE